MAVVMKREEPTWRVMRDEDVVAGVGVGIERGGWFTGGRLSSQMGWGSAMLLVCPLVAMMDTEASCVYKRKMG